ncbi:MAG: T9SS type A sorting domain-containing protein [Bacteroidetes bacterium]|nr:T9SS type A sorting domain-containing protein [Bacteroidota bacterium]
MIRRPAPAHPLNMDMYIRNGYNPIYENHPSHARRILRSSDAVVIDAHPGYPDMLPGLQIADKLTRSVIFNLENAQLRAFYKAHRCSINNERPTEGNAQRRIVFDERDPSLPVTDLHYAVYESGGGVYLMHSDDDGVTWGPEVLLSERGATCKRPALAIRDLGTSHGILYVTYVDEDASEVVLKVRADYGDPFAWTEVDRIAVTDATQCNPAIAAQQSGNEEGVFLVWEDVGVVIDQVQTNVLKFAIYEQGAPRSSGYYQGLQYHDAFYFRDAVLVEGQLTWQNQRRVPRFPSVTLMEPYPRFAVTWREEPGFLLYEDITWDPFISGPLMNMHGPETIPSPGITAQAAASLCEYNPGSTIMTVAYEADQRWTNWPVGTQSLAWPLQLGMRSFHPVTLPYIVWLPQPVVNPNPSRVYVRKRSGGIDAAGASWHTVARVLNIHRQDNNISAPSIGSQGTKLRVAVNNGFGGIGVADLDAFSPTIHSSTINDGFDPNMTVQGTKLHSVFSEPESGQPAPVQHRLSASYQGLRKTSAEITAFMREVTVSEDSSLAVYGICMPHLLLSDSSRLAIDWAYASFDTLALDKDATLGELTRTSSFQVPSGASLEYATELYGRHVGDFGTGFDIRIDFHDAQNGDLLLRDAIGVEELPGDSAWYVIYRIDLSTLATREVYMQLTLSERSDGMVVDIVDIFNLSEPLEKSGAVDGPVPVSGTVQLYQNYPNPFNPTTALSFHIPEEGDVKLSIHDNLGRHVTTVLSQHMRAGEHTVNFDARDMSSGVYYYRLRANGETHTRSMTLLR